MTKQLTIRELSQDEQAEIKRLATRYERVIRWSEEDNCYVGSLPELGGECCHGDSPEYVAKQLTISAESVLEGYVRCGFPIPRANRRPATERV